MKKRIWILLVLLALLAGCAKPQVPVDPDTGTENGGETQQPGDPVQTTPLLLQQAEAVGTAGNLWYIASEHVAEMEYPMMRVVDDNLLLWEYRYDENDTCTVHLKLLSLETGELVTECSYPSDGYVRLQVMENNIVICDSGIGRVWILGKDLQLQRYYELEANWGDWIMSPDMRNLYETHWETGLSRINLEMNVRVPIAEGREAVMIQYDDQAQQVFVSYLDLQTQRYAMKLLDIKTNTLSDFSLPVRVGWGVKDGDMYFISETGTWDRYHMLQGDKHTVMDLENVGQIKYLRENKWLYTMDMESRSPRLYTLDGKLVSAGELPSEDWLAGEPVWCQSWGGYFLLTTQAGSNELRLLFWDPKVQGVGQDLPVKPYGTEEPPPHTVEESLYQQAQALADRFGVDIRIAEQCLLDYDEFTGQALTDAYEIQSALAVLETALSRYPDGFLQQLRYGRIESIRIELIYGLTRKDWPADADYTSFAAFAQDKGDYYLIVIDVRSSGESTYYHELSHVIDRRLGWDTIYREGAMYSEDAWLQLQPPGFAYSYDYQHRPDNWADHLHWFVDDYSMTFPTEDRARVLEYSMMGWSWSFSERPDLIPKLDYYGKCIRDCFDTTGWPEQTAWEQTLAQAKQELAGAAA